MKPELYNQKAREAFAKSLIDIGVAIFKSVILLVTVVPIAVILKSAFDVSSGEVSLFEVLNGMSRATTITIISLVCIAVYIGHLFRKEGLKHLHEIEN